MENLEEFKAYFYSLKVKNVTVETIIKCLELNRISAAQNEFYHDGDKVYHLPELYKKIIELIGCRHHGKKNCDSWICNKVYKP